MHEFKNLIAQLYLTSKPTAMPFEQFYEQVLVAIHHSTKLPQRCQEDLRMPVDAQGSFHFRKDA